QQVNRNIDIIFMVDDSPSMLPLQKKMVAQLPTFMNVLKGLPGGLPDLHIGVVSSSLGGGVFTDLQTCAAASAANPDTLADRAGRFQHSAVTPPGCTGPSGNFITANADGSKNNFPAASDIADVLGCIALLGDRGCGFEQQFRATQTAIDKAGDP